MNINNNGLEVDEILEKLEEQYKYVNNMLKSLEKEYDELLNDLRLMIGLTSSCLNELASEFGSNRGFNDIIYNIISKYPTDFINNIRKKYFNKGIE